MIRIFRVECNNVDRPFTAGFLVRKVSQTNPELAEVVYHTAPILRNYLKGKSLKTALKFCQEHGWTVREIKE